MAAKNGNQLLFDFTFGDVHAHVEKAAAPAIRAMEKTLPLGLGSLPPPRIEEALADFNGEGVFPPHGAWLGFGRRLSVAERKRYNGLALETVKKPSDEITGEDRAALRCYSGFGGIAQEGERGVLYDFYTSPPIADMAWRLVHKICPVRKGARVLEPSCGTGVFFAVAPAGVTLAGVELDGRAASVARALFPRAHIKNQSFEAFNASGGKGEGFDYVIGNAPFGERSSAVSFLDEPSEKSLDRYFVSRGIDALREGGVMGLIVHPGILANESNDSWRLSIARKALFLGAVKLNDRSFAHTHTQVQPDILFFRRHPEDVEKRLAAAADGEIRSLFPSGWTGRERNYFETFPGHVMGRIDRGAGRWGGDVARGGVTPEGIRSLVDAFHSETYPSAPYETIRSRYPLPEGRAPREAPVSLADGEVRLVQSKELRPGALKVLENSVYILSEDHSWLPASHSENLAARLPRLIEITAKIKEIREAMREGGDASSFQAAAAGCLSEYHDSYQIYPKDDPVIQGFIRKHPSVSGIYDGLVDPGSPILASRNLYRGTGQIVDGHSPAVRALYTLRENMQEGNEETIKKWFPDEAAGLIEEMDRHPDIFLSPEGAYQLREDFISGNAWDKISALQAAIDSHPGDKNLVSHFTRAQDELRKAAGWTPVEEAAVTPRLPWIPEEIINSWVRDEDGLADRGLSSCRLGKNSRGKWGVILAAKKTEYDRAARKHITVGEAGDWLDHSHAVIYYLNRQKQRSALIDTETFNREKDDSFKNYIANHARYRDAIENTFNRLYNAEIKAPVKTYPVCLDGWSGAKTLKPHQWQSVHHLYRQGRGISALGTGFGKTLTGIALYALLKQEARLSRAFFQVPNNKVKDWVREISDVLPGLAVGYIDPEMPGYSSREKRYAAYHRLANFQFDILVMPESAASEIQLAPENDERITRDAVAKHLVEKQPGTARQAENAKEQARRSFRNGKTSRVITFEDFACDALFVDEAHRYKNLFTSSLSRQTGMNDGRQSAKAMALFKKAAFVRSRNCGKNVFLFTATPLTNSPLEYYNMLNYIAPEELEKFSINTIDGFIHSFADIHEGQAYDWKSGQVVNKKILKGFKNIRTLQNIFFKYTDYQADPKSISLEKPDPVHKPNIIPKDETQAAAVRAISEDLELYCKLEEEERKTRFPGQNYLTFYTKMRAASLDIELYSPSAWKNWENPKLAALANNAREIYRNTGAGQIVFCDRVFSSDLSFNMHEKIKSCLAKAGFSENEIAIVNGFAKSGAAMSDSRIEEELSKTVAAFNAGKYKILIGTTSCIGEGLNLQENSGAVHHFDIPFRPSDFIQRNGRADRQGNAQGKVHINTYMAAGTIDNYSVSLVQNKANWIDELLNCKTDVFVNRDDESGIDAGELLLALTEEWGDASKAAERRAEMKRAAEEKIAEEEKNRRADFMSSLAKMRGSLNGGKINRGSFSVAQRLEKIALIEKALLSMPSFASEEIIGAKSPFLYSRASDRVVMTGDLAGCRGYTYTVASLNFKKQEFDITIVNPDDLNSYNRDYLRKLTVPVDKMESHLDEFVHLPGPEIVRLYSSLGKNDFYKINNNSLKEQFYHKHLDKCSENKPVFIRSDNIVTVKFEEYSSPDGAYLNPFKKSDIEIINSSSGLSFGTDDAEEKRTLLSFIKNNLPGAFTAISEKLANAPPVYKEIVSDERNTPAYFKQNLVDLCAHPYYRKDPFLAAKTIVENTPPGCRDALASALSGYGCVDKDATKKLIENWASRKSADDFIEKHLRIAGVEL
jgi:N12 class adenine-specific DNA methylase